MNSCPLIPANWELPTVLRIRLGHGPGKQRVMEAEGHLLLVLHEVPKQHQAERVGRLFWRQPHGNWLTSVPGASGAGLEEHIKTYTKTVDHLTEEVEAARNSTDYFQILGNLSPLARTARNLYSTLQEARKLRNDDQQLLDFRDEAYDLARRVELLQNDAKIALDFEVAHQAELQAEASHQMAASAHRLNVLAAFFFPLATLSAVLGTNLQHLLPKLSHTTALLVLLIVGMLLGSGLTYLITRPAIRPTKKANSD